MAAQRVGPYQLLREIGRSNHVVYEALDTRRGQRVALKVLDLPPTLQGVERAQQVERFQREVRASMLMDHPNVVRTYESGTDGERLYVAMEYLEGQSLADLLKERGYLAPGEALLIIAQACQALTYAHTRGVVHRDIKPGNVFILKDGRVKLTDFGIARLVGDPRMTTDGQTVGTPYYMSPEQIAGQEVTSASDIFSMGVLIYEALTGRKPFCGTSVAEITKAVVETEPDYPGTLGPHVSRVLRKALAKYPPARFATAEELARALAGAPVVEPAYSPVYAAPQDAAVPYAPAAQPSGTAAAYPAPPRTYGERGLLVPLAVLGVIALVVMIAGPTTFARYREDTLRQAAMRHLLAAQAFADQRLYDSALAESRQAVALAPEGSETAAVARQTLYEVLVGSATELAASGQAAEAIKQAEEAVQLEPDKPEAYLALGVARFRAGDPEGALEALDTAASLSTDAETTTRARETQARIHLQSGRDYARQQQTPQAIYEFQAAIDAAPGSDTAAQAEAELQRLYAMPARTPRRFPR